MSLVLGRDDGDPSAPVLMLSVPYTGTHMSSPIGTPLSDLLLHRERYEGGVSLIGRRKCAASLHNNFRLHQIRTATLAAAAPPQRFSRCDTPV